MLLGHVLEGAEQPSQVVQQSQSPVQFLLHLAQSPATVPRSDLGSPSPQKPSNNLLRIHYQLQHGVQSFTSLIITPTMTAADVLDLAVSKALPSEPASNYTLTVVTSKGGTYVSALDHSDLTEANKVLLRVWNAFSAI